MDAVKKNATLVGLTELRTKANKVLEALLDRIEDRVLGYVALERTKTADVEFIDLEDVEQKFKRRAGSADPKNFR